MVRNVLLFAAFFSLAGCSKGGPKAATVPVSGTVTFKGAPLEGAQVVFEPKVVDGKRASGITDASGTFTLRTYLGGVNFAQGAEPGDFEVSIKKVATPSGIKPPSDPTQPAAAASQEDLEREKKPMDFSRAELATPAVYANPTTSGFTATVTQAGPNDQLKFDLIEK